MSIVDDRPAAADQPEEPTNRPEVAYRLREWLVRPYVRPILTMFVLFCLLVIPIAWLVVFFMNMSGAPASDIMSEIEQTILVFTIVSAPLMSITLTILLYSLFGWGRVTGDEPPMQESPAIRSNATGSYLWIGATSLLAAFLVIWGLLALANITASSYGSVSANPDQGKISSDVLVVPIDTPIYFNVTSVDVIHSFWVVELGVKIDANPGAITNTGVTPNKLGNFNIRCAELCGMHHAYMETQIQVVTQEQFDSWVREMGGKRTA